MTCNPKQYCAACNHARSNHYKDMDDVLRCNYTESGTTTRGVIGLPYTIGCDCTNQKVMEKPDAR